MSDNTKSPDKDTLRCVILIPKKFNEMDSVKVQTLEKFIQVTFGETLSSKKKFVAKS